MSPQPLNLYSSIVNSGNDPVFIIIRQSSYLQISIHRLCIILFILQIGFYLQKVYFSFASHSLKAQVKNSQFYKSSYHYHTFSIQKQLKMNSITDSIIKLQATMNETLQQQLFLQNQLSLVISQNQELSRLQAKKIEQIQQLLSELKINAEKQQNYLKKMKEKVQFSVKDNKNEKNAFERKPIIALEDYTYIINQPQQLECVTDKAEQLEERQKGLKKARQDEIRTTKIKISLAEIQLKQFQARQKRK